MGNLNPYGYESEVEDMADSRLRRQHAPYTNPRIFKAKTTNTYSKQWNLECQDRFLKSIQQLGGIDKASPEAVLALMNKDNLHCLDLEEIADQMHIHREYFKKMEGQQENPNVSSKNVTITWTRDRIARLMGVVKRLGGVNKVSAEEILEAMKEDINDGFCLTIDEIAYRLYCLRALFNGIEEGGYGPVRRRGLSTARSGPYGQGSVGPKIGSRVEFLWTLDRHKRFVDAVEKLGGVVRATPRAILEVMKEEGLTRLIVLRHLDGLRRLLRGTERVTNSAGSNLFNVHSGDQAKEASSSWSNSGSIEDVLNNFRELNLRCQVH